MSYIQEFEQELQAKLQGGEDTASIVRWVSEKVLESYKNGLGAARKRKAVNGKGSSRESGATDKAE